MKYIALCAMFVNVSIDGTLISFAAPPVFMVAARFNWNSTYMLQLFPAVVILFVHHPFIFIGLFLFFSTMLWHMAVAKESADIEESATGQILPRQHDHAVQHAAK